MDSIRVVRFFSVFLFFVLAIVLIHLTVLTSSNSVTGNIVSSGSAKGAVVPIIALFVLMIALFFLVNVRSSKSKKGRLIRLNLKSSNFK